jgi:hypothetical protein
MPPQAVDEFTTLLGSLAANAGISIAGLLSRVAGMSKPEAYAYITDAYPALMTPFMTAAGELTVQWYAAQPALPVAAGAVAFVPVVAELPENDQLAISARWALTQIDPLTALRGNATRQVLNSSRRTVLDNVFREGTRWVRHAQPDACGFCRMLATRTGHSRFATTYTGAGLRERTAREQLDGFGRYELRVSGRRGGQTRNNRPTAQKIGDKYHDHCRCTAVPVRDGRYEPPDYVQKWQQDYKSAAKEYGDAPSIATAMDKRKRDRAAEAERRKAREASVSDLPPVNLDQPPDS